MNHDWAIFILGLFPGLIIGSEMARRAYKNCARQLFDTVEVMGAFRSNTPPKWLAEELARTSTPAS